MSANAADDLSPLSNNRKGTGLNMATKTATITANTASPLADRVVVRPIEEAEQKRGGLFIPDTAKEKPQQGEVLAVGPGRWEEGKRLPVEVKVGDKILYGKYSGNEVTINGEQVLIFRESDILAVIS
jgi:chaperonin GroES